jgi:hypothetical protein
MRKINRHNHLKRLLIGLLRLGTTQKGHTEKCYNKKKFHVGIELVLIKVVCEDNQFFRMQKSPGDQKRFRNGGYTFATTGLEFSKTFLSTLFSTA